MFSIHNQSSLSEIHSCLLPVEILSEICSVCQKIATSCPAYFFWPMRRLCLLWNHTKWADESKNTHYQSDTATRTRSMSQTERSCCRRCSSDSRRCLQSVAYSTHIDTNRNSTNRKNTTLRTTTLR